MVVMSTQLVRSIETTIDRRFSLLFNLDWFLYRWYHSSLPRIPSLYDLAQCACYLRIVQHPPR